MIFFCFYKLFKGHEDLSFINLNDISITYRSILQLVGIRIDLERMESYILLSLLCILGMLLGNEASRTENIVLRSNLLSLILSGLLIKEH